MPAARWSVAGIALGPLLLAVIGVTHPHQLNPDTAGYWKNMHIGLLVVFPLLGINIWWLLRGLHHPVAWTARGLALVYAGFYGALDVLAGIATGLVVDPCLLRLNGSKKRKIQQHQRRSSAWLRSNHKEPVPFVKVSGGKRGVKREETGGTPLVDLKCAVNGVLQQLLTVTLALELALHSDKFKMDHWSSALGEIGSGTCTVDAINGQFAVA